MQLKLNFLYLALRPGGTGNSLPSLGPESRKAFRAFFSSNRKELNAPLRLSLSKPGSGKRIHAKARKEGRCKGFRPPQALVILPGLQANRRSTSVRSGERNSLAPLRPLRSLRETLQPRYLAQGPLGPGLRRDDGLGFKTPLRLSLSKPGFREKDSRKGAKRRKAQRVQAAAGACHSSGPTSQPQKYQRALRRAELLSASASFAFSARNLATALPGARPAGPRPAPG